MRWDPGSYPTAIRPSWQALWTGGRKVLPAVLMCAYTILGCHLGHSGAQPELMD